MTAITSTLKKQLKKADTDEKCGLILSDNKVIVLTNRHTEPEKGYRIAASDLMDYENDMIATWHTHPHDTANLSQEDYAGFLQWPELSHYIIGVDGVRCFRVVDGMVVEGN